MTERFSPIDYSNDEENGGQVQKNENEHQENLVKFGTWFRLLDPDKKRGTLVDLEGVQITKLDTEMRLDSGIFDEPLDFSLALFPFPNLSKADVLNPFYPDNGYRLSDEDFEVEQHKKKHSNAKKEAVEKVIDDIEQSKAMVFLTRPPIIDIKDPTEEQVFALKRIALELCFPGAKVRTHFETEFSGLWFTGERRNNSFYPSDIPPIILPTDMYHGLILPNNQGLLSQSYARFIKTVPQTSI